MSIPFTQYMRPDGRQKLISIERPTDIEDMAVRFIETGGWYDAEVLMTGQVSLTAGRVVDEEPQDIECQIVDNGPGIGEGVDRLVIASVKHIPDSI